MAHGFPIFFERVWRTAVVRRFQEPIGRITEVWEKLIKSIGSVGSNRMPILTTNWVAVWKPPTTDGAKSLGDDQQEEAKEQTKQVT